MRRIVRKSVLMQRVGSSLTQRFGDFNVPHLLANIFGAV